MKVPFACIAALALAASAPAAAQSSWNDVPQSPSKSAAAPQPSAPKPGQPAAQPKAPSAGTEAGIGDAMDRREMRRIRQEMFVRMDLDHDGKLTRSEIERVRDGMQAAWAERNPGANAAQRPPPFDVDFFFRINDRNRDFSITMEEFLLAVDERFKQFDRNGDGRITKEEVEAAQKVERK